MRQGSQRRGTQRSFGRIARLPSKRYRARYIGPDAALHTAPLTFQTREDAEAWLTDERRLISPDPWTSPTGRRTASRRAEEARPARVFEDNAGPVRPDGKGLDCQAHGCLGPRWRHPPSQESVMEVVVTTQVPQIRSCATLSASHLDCGAVWVLELFGEADVATESMLREELARAVGMNREYFVVDVTRLVFCDVRSAHLIVAARRTGPVYVTGASWSVKRVFDWLDSLGIRPR